MGAGPAVPSCRWICVRLWFMPCLYLGIRDRQHGRSPGQGRCDPGGGHHMLRGSVGVFLPLPFVRKGRIK